MHRKYMIIPSLEEYYDFLAENLASGPKNQTAKMRITCHENKHVKEDKPSAVFCSRANLQVETRQIARHIAQVSCRIWGLHYFPGLSLSQALNILGAWYSTFPMQVSLLPLSPSPCETTQKMLKDWRMAKPELGRFDNFWRGLRSLHSRLTTCKI